jgi:DNA-binding FadR family transcriptional regulator
MGLMPSVAALATEDDLQRCAHYVELMEQLESAGESALEADRDFHLSLYASLNNALVNNLIEIFWELYRRLDGPVRALEGDLHHAPLHAAIVEALKERDGDLAMVRMREHFDDVRARVRTLAAQEQIVNAVAAP